MITDGDGLVDTQDTEDCPMAEAPEEAAPVPTPTPEVAPEEEETFVEESIDEGNDVDEGDGGNGASSDDEAGDESDEEGGDEEE